MITLGIVIGFVCVYIIADAIYDFIKEQRQKKLDIIVKEVLQDFNFEKEKQEVLSIIKKILPVEYSCPNCGIPLRAIRGKYGKFIGCTGYPDCRYSRKKLLKAYEQ